MSLASMRQVLDEAAKGGYGVGAFNVNNMEQIQAIMEAARETRSPAIIQASRGGRAYSNDRFLYHLMVAATELYPEIPTVLHQDHGNSPQTCKSAIEMGFTSVMMDGSLLADGKTPSSFEYNVKTTREVVEMAHERRGTRRACAPHRSPRSGGIRPADRCRRARHRHRHEPRRLQVRSTAHR